MVIYKKTFFNRISDCTTATLQGSQSIASSYGFSETDETMTAETITPNQLTLQAISTDEEDCIVDELAKDPISASRLSRDIRETEYHQENASMSSDNESGNSIPLQDVDSRAGMNYVTLEIFFEIKFYMTLCILQKVQNKFSFLFRY